MLLFSEFPEELDLLLARRLPIIVGLEGTLQMCLDIYVERLGL